VGATLGLVTIGQTPRPDLEAEFRRHNPDAEIVMLGALDGLTDDEVADLAAENGEYPLHTRLASGATVDVPMDSLVPLVAERARSLATFGADLVVVLCAGGFPDFDCQVPLLLPGRVVPAVIGSLSRNRRVGVVTPIREQVEAAQAKWEADGFSVKVTSASPFRHEEIRQAAAVFSDPTLDMVVLDCMGHDEGYRREFAGLCPRPVLLAQTLVARVTGEVLDGCASGV
jgi:protein AroM